MSKPNRTITEKRTELGELLAWFESEKFTPEEAIERFKTAQKLAQEIETELMEQKNTIRVLKQKFDEGIIE